jgi:hypothetical protein
MPIIDRCALTQKECPRGHEASHEPFQHPGIPPNPAIPILPAARPGRPPCLPGRVRERHRTGAQTPHQSARRPSSGDGDRPGGFRSRPATGRPPAYEALLPLIKALWQASEQPCGKRLRPILRDWLPYREKAHGAIPAAHRLLLKKVSAAQLDRLLAPCSLPGQRRRAAARARRGRHPQSPGPPAHRAVGCQRTRLDGTDRREIDRHRRPEGRAPRVKSTAWPTAAAPCQRASGGPLS